MIDVVHELKWTEFYTQVSSQNFGLENIFEFNFVISRTTNHFDAYKPVELWLCANSKPYMKSMEIKLGTFKSEHEAKNKAEDFVIEYISSFEENTEEYYAKELEEED